MKLYWKKTTTHGFPPPIHWSGQQPLTWSVCIVHAFWHGRRIVKSVVITFLFYFFILIFHWMRTHKGSYSKRRFIIFFPNDCSIFHVVFIAVYMHESYSSWLNCFNLSFYYAKHNTADRTWCFRIQSVKIRKWARKKKLNLTCSCVFPLTENQHNTDWQKHINFK